MRDDFAGSPEEFPTTWWTLLDRAQADGSTIRGVALDELVRRYSSPLRAHLILRKRLGEELADELLQGFMAEKFVAQYLLRHANPQKGKFRSLLVSSLDHYFIDWIRKHKHECALPADFDVAAAPAGDADIFDAAWARQLLDETLEAMRVDCEANGQAAIWGVFECRLLTPARQNVPPVPYDVLCEQFELGSPEKASNALVTAKRKFEKAFARVAVHYQHDDEEAADILRELVEVLSRVGPLDWRATPDDGDKQAGNSSISQLDLGSSHPGLLARLLTGPSDADVLWQPDDLAGLMRHQLIQRLVDLDLRISGDELAALTTAATVGPLVTLADVFNHPRPPLTLLEAVKRYGRRHVHDDQKKLPNEIASALYFASIAAALVHHDKRISTSGDEVLAHGFQRLLDCPWITEPLRGLYKAGLVSVGRDATAE